MSYLSAKTICFIADSAGGYKHLFSALRQEKAMRVVSVKKPLKQSPLDKFFEHESDLNTIKESLLDKPTIYNFDQVCRGAK